MNLGKAGCVELLDHPELCKIKNTTWEEPYSSDRKSHYWFKEATLVHALAVEGHDKILDYPEFLKIPNKFGQTPLHLLVKSYVPDGWERRRGYEIPENVKKILDKVLKIEGLDKLKAEGDNDVTPLHHIGELGYIPLLDYPNVGYVESPEWNCHGTPLTHLYLNATDGLGKLLRHPHLLTEYKTHGTPLESLSRNSTLRPTVKELRRYKIKMEKSWHSSKKLDKKITADIQSVAPAIQFILY